MSLRDYLNGRLSGLDQDIEQGGLDEYGLGDLPADSFSTALLHFAEQSPMETADALAPIVTRLSPVPFEPGDLPDAPEAEAILADGGDAFDLFDELTPTDASLGAIYDDADPSSFDDEADLSDELDEIDDALESGGPDPDEDNELDDLGADEADLDLGDDLDDGADDPDHRADLGTDEADDLDGGPGAYGGGGVEDDDLDGGDDRSDDPVDEDDGFDDLDELGDFERVDHDLGSEQVHPVEERTYDEVADQEEGDDPAEIGFDLE